MLKFKFVVISAAVLLFVNLLAISTAAERGAEEQFELWFFWGDGCDLCETASIWLDDLNITYPDLVIHRKEVFLDQEEQNRYIQMMEERGMIASWVPGFILEDKVWEGFTENIADEIEQLVEDRLEYLTYGITYTGGAFNGGTISLGPFGEVEIYKQSLITATMLIALVDGFNPCSLWVITFLLAMILHTQSRGRIAVVGLTFLLVTAAVYGLFITGLFTALTAATQIGRIRVIVALLAMGFAALNVKDYFFFGQGPSLSIPDRFKPSIYRSGREITKQRPLLPALALTAVFAAGVAVVELPCTAGFPALWTGLLSEAGLAGSSFIIFLLVYLLVYLLIEILIVFTAVVTMRITRLQETHGRKLKLIGGMFMAAIALVILIDPAIMERLTGSLYIIGGALIVSGLIIFGRWLWFIMGTFED